MQRATVIFQDGTILVAEVPAPKGVEPAMMNEEIVEKWRGLAKSVIDDERREKIERLCLSIDSLDDITELGDLLAGVTLNPIA